MPEVKLHYSISNNGDGSASVHFYANAEEAEAADREAEESGEPFAEGTAGYVTLSVEDGKVFYKDWDYETIKGKFQRVDKTIQLTND